MKNIITPSYTTIGDIFEKNFLFEVPKYQRYYSWESEQVDDYIKDIANIYANTSPQNHIDHFFGGIVVVNKPIAGSNRSQRELIDGQQRITTTILLIISIIQKYQEICTTESQQIIEDSIKQLESKYLIYKDKINRVSVNVPKLELSNADRQYFQDIVNGNECYPTRESHRRINKALQKLKKFVNSIVKNAPTLDEKIDALTKIEDIIHNNCTIIFIDSQTRESAYKLFQVLNDRGAGLTEGDLLKSRTLEALEANFPDMQNGIEQCWDNILQDEPKTTEQFLRYYYASVCGKRVGRTSLYDDFLKQFFPHLVDMDSVSDAVVVSQIVLTVNELLSEVKTYRKITSGEWPYKSQQPITDWDRKRLDILINYLNFDIVYPILLAGAKMKEKKFSELVQMLEKFMFRYKTVCNLPHQKIGDLFMVEAVKIRANPDNYRLSELRKALRTYIQDECTEELFKAGISTLKYKTNANNKTLKYLFSTLNEYVEWYSNGAEGKPKAHTASIMNYDDVTIEHISSQATASPLEAFSGDNMHKFYNLTLLTREENDRVEDKNYADKKPIYINSNYILNKYFNVVDDWTYDNAQNWETYLKDFACKVFVV